MPDIAERRAQPAAMEGSKENGMRCIESGMRSIENESPIRGRVMPDMAERQAQPAAMEGVKKTGYR